MYIQEVPPHSETQSSLKRNSQRADVQQTSIYRQTHANTDTDKDIENTLGQKEQKNEHSGTPPWSEIYIKYKQRCTMNDSPFDSAYKSRLSAWEDLVVGVYLLLIGILALGLNTLVIYTCLKHWRSLVLSDYYILSLACSDVILPLSSFPLAIISSLYHGWMFGDTGCKMYGFFGFFLGIGSITTVTVMGIMRYISICKPHIKITSRRCIIASTIFPYFYAFAWSFLRLKWFGSYRLEWDDYICHVLEFRVVLDAVYDSLVPFSICYGRKPIF
ncbi:melanopsin-B-like [Mercenaria mercenaria]|uniref:melanopsin-B-like n=1 Tax=Mercenaria mercenaria TaxID=6596 RepID=UPI00234F6077|nr:melanopsin-B-like [Mercenaria mercenaria]